MSNIWRLQGVGSKRKSPRIGIDTESTKLARIVFSIGLERIVLISNITRRCDSRAERLAPPPGCTAAGRETLAGCPPGC